MDTLLALWDFHKENILLTFIAGILFAAGYEIASFLLRKFLKPYE